MSMFEDTNAHELKALLGQIHNRQAALPDFQRDFVWDPSATRELIISVANNYPAGSLLRIRNTHDLFASREFQGAPPLEAARPTYLVLDGQQRLTSLYQAFYGVGEHRYFLRVGELLAGKDFEESIFHLRANHKRAHALASIETQAKDLIMPLEVLRNGSGGFLTWSFAVANKRSVDADGLAFMNELTAEIGSRWIQTIDDYRFPVVTLSDETPADAVCTIFETLNRTGVRLSPFELLTARFWPQKDAAGKPFSLRALWESAREKYPIIEYYGVDPYYMLQAIALIGPQATGCKRSDVLSLPVDRVEGSWDAAVKGMALSLKLLRDDCGVLAAKWVPYETMLIPMAAVLAQFDIEAGKDAGQARNKLIRWFWCAVLGQAYENSGNTMAARDVPECLAWFTNDAAVPQTVRDFRFDPKVMRDTTVRQRALYKGLMALSLRKQPRDFFTAAPLTWESVLHDAIDDHHIFPQSFLKKTRPDVTDRLRDCILNRTLIRKLTDIGISAEAPSAYMAEIRARLGPGPFGDLLRSHHLPGGPDSALWTNDFDEFLAWREAELWREVQEVSGIIEATDLLDEEAFEPATA